MKDKDKQVQIRKNKFVERQSTKIWWEEPSSDNPYIAANHYCHGYNLIELMKERSFIDVFFLLFNAKLPSKSQAEVLECLMSALINPGPRHAATRAAMNTAIGKTDTHQILPISLAILGGSYLGSDEVESSMRFIKKHTRKEPFGVAETLLSNTAIPEEGDCHPVAGFGSRFSGIDEFPKKIADHLLSLEGAGKNLRWCSEFVSALKPHNMGWLITGVAAATFADLGFNPRCGAGLFQLLSAPGMLAHGLELSNKPITAMPFVKDEDYLIEK
jgi:citrate synthase